MTRIIIYTKDICLITGKGQKYARNLIQKIRLHQQRASDIPLTIYDVCDYLRIDPDKAKDWLR